jgi:hypothetical protein
MPNFLQRWCASFLWVSMLVSGCGGSADPEALEPESARLATITVSPANASLRVGQNQALAAEARDQNGALMSGVVFSWRTSNGAVATVADGMATALAAGSASITASSAGVTSNPAAVTVTAAAVSSIVIDRASVFFTGTGQSASLTAQLRDPQGSLSTGSPVTWVSSAPEKVSVDANGRLVAVAIGSAQIVAESAGVRSAPTLVFVAQPKAGTVLVSDAQVVAVGAPLGLSAGQAPGLGTQYEVTLKDVATPALGTIVLAAESAPVVGKVVATRQDAAGLVVTLALAPMYQVFDAYDIRLNIELSAFPLEAVAERPVAAQGPLWPRGQVDRVRALDRARTLEEFEPFRAWRCDARIKPKLLDAPIQLSLENSLRLVIESTPGHAKQALEGSLSIVGSAGLKLAAAFQATGRCDAQGQVKLPVLGWASWLVMPGVRVGIGAELDGKVKLVNAELSVRGTVGLSGTLGWECGGTTSGCAGLNTLTAIKDLKTTSTFPSGANDQMEAEISAHFYAIAGIDAVIFGGIYNAEIVEARVGPKQSFKLAFEEDQAARADYASGYDLKLDGVIEPGSALQKAIEKFIGDDSTTVSFSADFSADLSESPKGTLAISMPRAAPGQAVDFTVDITAKTESYWLLGYNVEGVELYRKRDDESKFTPWKSMDLIGSNRATYRWTPLEADAGRYEFAAFVNTKLVTPLLEIAPNSIRPLEVTCYSVAPPPAGSAGRERPLAANLCVDTWEGTLSAQVPDLIEWSGTITWKPDATLNNAPNNQGTGQTFYRPSGSVTVRDTVYTRLGCTVTPNQFVTFDDTSLLVVNRAVSNPPSYSWSLSTHVDRTIQCPDSPPLTIPAAVAFAQTGAGQLADQNTRMQGNTVTPQGSSSFTFTRPGTLPPPMARGAARR